MSVIPFSTNVGKNQSVVERKEDFKMEGECILISNADQEQLSNFVNGKAANTSYDLRVGSVYWDVSKDNTTTLEKGVIKLKPKMFVEIETKEFVKFPQNVSGRISSKVSMLRKGLGVFPTNIDPGYEGVLVIYVCNFGNDTVELKPEAKFCALKIETVKGQAHPYQKEGKKAISNEKQGYIKYIQWFKYNLMSISIVINILMLIATVCMAYFTYVQSSKP